MYLAVATICGLIPARSRSSRQRPLWIAPDSSKLRGFVRFCFPIEDQRRNPTASGVRIRLSTIQAPEGGPGCRSSRTWRDRLPQAREHRSHTRSLIGQEIQSNDGSAAKPLGVVARTIGIRLVSPVGCRRFSVRPCRMRADRQDTSRDIQYGSRIWLTI